MCLSSTPPRCRWRKISGRTDGSAALRVASGTTTVAVRRPCARAARGDPSSGLASASLTRPPGSEAPVGAAGFNALTFSPRKSSETRSLPNGMLTITSAR